MAIYYATPRSPTRLLDWTFSAYVALFFAIIDVQPNGRCAVWALNQTQCMHNFSSGLPDWVRDSLSKDDKDLKATNWMLTDVNTQQNAAVCSLNPFRLNMRLAVQRGTFLVPINPNRSFEENMEESVREHPEICQKFVIHCRPAFLREAFRELRQYNISDLSLFPDLDGFSRFLKMLIALPEVRPLGWEDRSASEATSPGR